MMRRNSQTSGRDDDVQGWPRSLTVEDDTTQEQLERFILECLVQRPSPAKLSGRPQGETFVVRVEDPTANEPVGNCTVLVVEDHEPTQRLEQFILEEAGYNIHVVASGEKALDSFEGVNPSVVLMDVGLEGMDGFSTCQRIREFSQVPIIMVTGRDCVDDQVRALEVGADDYLTKSFLSHELAERVAVLLKLARHNHEDANARTSVTELDKLYEGDVRLLAEIHGSVRTAVEFVGKLKGGQQFHGVRVTTREKHMDISFKLRYPFPLMRLLLQWGQIAQAELASTCPPSSNAPTTMHMVLA